MTSLRERFTADLKEAMKAGEKGKVSTIRLITSALKDKDIEARGLGKPETTPDEILALLQKMIKQRQESIAIYDANGRPELAAGERAEVEVINTYLPKQMSEDEVKAVIAAAVTESGAASVKDMGKVIAILRAKFAGQMDFAKASGLVKAALGG
ncbi:GatB/YqeY domain-containing protein [Bosea sp. 685]|uniref:GatB/YqeY domain-containing protein n=1 Tax=Bosea sp. 685 TaxID=3080057 RepID=UPI002893168C|nr:GatB/YqeY domain-containing protein [Bosea sp. 685]WNJ92268.1 GatB/YqeY domain-containing protein [Bosea sp. 685]